MKDHDEKGVSEVRRFAVDVSFYLHRGLQDKNWKWVGRGESLHFHNGHQRR